MIGTLHIVLAMKPTQGDFAENAVVFGVAGLNVDECRVGEFQNTTPSGVNRRNAKLAELGYRPNEYWMGNKTPNTSQGRWPANVILSHAEGCVLKGMKKVKGHAGYPNGPGGLWSKEYQETNVHARNWNNASSKKDNEPWTGHADAEGKETIEDWECAESCPVRNLGEQSGEPNKQAICKTDDKSGWQNEYVGGKEVRPVERKLYLDAGTAARFFYTVKELKIYDKESD